MNGELLEFDALRPFPSLSCVVSRRTGGVSKAPYATLNLGFSVGDEVASVVKNRQRLFRRAGLDAGQVVVCRQAHGTTIVHVDRQDAGRGALDVETAVPECDGLLTTAPGVHVMVQSADCPLVAIFAPPACGVVAVHSGWRGTAARIVPEAVRRLEDATKVAPRAFLAVLAPAIGGCCYDVGPEVLRVMRRFGVGVRHSPREGHGFLSLRSVLVKQLEASGIPRDQIQVHEDCTHCRRDLYYSYRRSGSRTGRFGLLAGVRG